MSIIDLSGRIALVTGSSRGIGRAIALANARADAAIHYRISRAEAEQVASSIQQAGQRALIFQGDVRSAAVYLCSCAASGITGVTLPVEAGYLCCGGVCQ